MCLIFCLALIQARHRTHKVGKRSPVSGEGTPKGGSAGGRMDDGLFRLSEERIERIRPFFPKSRGTSCGDESTVVRGSIHMLRHGLHPRRCPTLQPPSGSDRWCQGGLTSTLHVVCDGSSRPVRLHRSEGQCSDFTGADLLPRDLSVVRVLTADKRYGSNKVRAMCWSKASLPASHPDGTVTGGSLTARGFTRPAIGGKALRQAQGLATHRQPLSPLCSRLSLCCPPRRHRHLLVIVPVPRLSTMGENAVH